MRFRRTESLARKFGKEKYQRADEREDDIDDKDSDRLVNGFFGNGASHDLGPFAAEKPVESEQRDDRRRCRLETAAAAAGARSDEHGDDDDDHAGLSKGERIDGVESRCPGGDGNKGRGKNLFGDVLVTEGSVPFDGEDACHFDENDGERREERDFRVEGNFLDAARLEVEKVLDFGHGEKPEASRKNQQDDDGADDRVGLKAHKRIGEGRKSRVAECADRMEYRVENPLVERQVFELREEGCRAKTFEDNGERQDRREDLFRVDVSVGRKSRLEDRLLAKSRTHSREQENRRRKCHDAQTADLNQGGDNPESRMGKGRADIGYRKTRDADRRCRREERIDDRKVLLQREGTLEKNGPEDDEKGIAFEQKEHRIRGALFRYRVRDRNVLVAG